jgi:hypothetical protein
VQDAKANGGAAAQTARARNFFFGRAGKRKVLTFRSPKEEIGGLGRNRRERFTLCRARDGYRIMNAKRDAQAIEAGSKIGSAGWDPKGNLLRH